MEKQVRVLIVDDDRRMVRTVADILKIKGYAVLEAFSGEEAVEAVKNSHPDCVLMDIKMPGINGVDALKLFKNACPGMPVILMSAYATEELEQEARAHGAYAVLTKPIDFQIVLSFLSLLRREETILVVDDDPHFYKTLTDVLETRGYTVETELDPARVLGRMEQSYKLVVVLDLKLGKGDGIDVLQSIREKYPTKPVVLVTGHRESMTDSIARGIRIGAYTCMYKPFDAMRMLESIEEIRRDKLSRVLYE